MIGAGDVAGAAGAGADARRGLHHGADHLWMLAHAEIIVGAPDHDVARPLRGMPDRVRIAAGDALEVGEHAIAPFLMKATKGGIEELTVIHRKTRRVREGTEAALGLFRVFPALLSSRK